MQGLLLWITNLNAFQKNLVESDRKPNKILVDQGSEFYSRSLKLWFHENSIDMHSTQNDRKSVVADRFIWTLDSKVYKHMTAVLKNVQIDKLFINTTTHIIEQSKWSLSTLIQVLILTMVLGIMAKLLNLKLVTMWEYQYSFFFFLQKCHTPNWTEEVFVIKKVVVPWS